MNFTSIPPFRMLYYAAALGGLLAPPFMILIMLIANDPKIMGRRVNSRLSNILGWTATGVMTACAVALLLQWLS